MNMEQLVKEVTATVRKHCSCDGPASSPTINKVASPPQKKIAPHSPPAVQATRQNKISEGPPKGKPAKIVEPPFDQAGFDKCIRNANIGETAGTVASAGLMAAGAGTFGITTIIGAIGGLVTKGVAGRAKQKCVDRFGAA